MSAPTLPQRRRRPATLALLPALALALAGCGKSAPGGAAAPPPPAPSAGIFEDVTTRARLDFKHQLADGKLSNIMESDGAGGVVFDYDGDGFMDIYLVNSGPAPVLSDAPPGTPRWPNRLFHNKGDGTFEDATEPAGAGGRGFGVSAASADYDNDGRPDLLVLNFGGCVLYHNEGGGRFKDVTAQAGIICTNACISAVFLDIDNDGWLDLFIANYLTYDPAVVSPPNSPVPYPGPLNYPAEFNILYRNKGGGVFEDVSQASGVRVPNHRAMSVTAFDYNLDGHTDLYISNDGTPNLLLVNDGKGHFTDMAVPCGAAFNQFGEAAGSMGAAIGDCDNDGFPDILVTRFGNPSLYINSKPGLFEDRIVASGILAAEGEFTGWGGNLLDFDNDGLLDLFIANGDPHFMRGMPPVLLRNTGAALFTNASPAAGPFFASRLNARGSAALDFNNDGLPDLLVTTLGDRAFLLQNRLRSTNHWLTLKLEGARSNRDGLGARATLTAAGRPQSAQARCAASYLFQQDPRLHFGLGPATVADTLEIRWPSGAVQTLARIPADQILTVREPGDSRWAAPRQP